MTNPSNSQSWARVAALRLRLKPNAQIHRQLFRDELWYVLEDHASGRYHRFFQSMSLFCFSMLGVVISGNLAMTFVFWELVGICSYFLIGFYIARKSASTRPTRSPSTSMRPST